MGCWCQNTTHSHLIFGLLNGWVLRTSLALLCSHSPHRQCLERRLAHSHWMSAPHSKGPLTHTLRHPASWTSPNGSDTLLGYLNPDHILYGLLSVSSDTCQARIRSRRPFVPAVRNLLDNLAGLGIRASEWKNHKWNAEYCENSSRLRVFCAQHRCQACWDGLTPSSLG